MRFKREKYRRDILPAVLPLAIILLVLMLSTTLYAEQYYVWGRVYCASPLAEDEVAPPNPSTGIPDHQVIGDNRFAEIPRNLVRVRVIKASDSSELGRFETTKYGNYFISFNEPGPTISARFVVEELLSGEVLLESGPNELSQWTTPADEHNIRYLLVRETLIDISKDREFALSAPGTHTGIFTRVAKIEVETEVEGTAHRLINTSTGRVTVPPVVAQELAIHQYKEAPLGGNLFIFGAFDQPLYSIGVHYRIKITNLDTSTDTYMSDLLVKTKYTVDLTTMPIAVTAERITLGPKTIGAIPNCYELTPLSTSAGSVHTFWSFPDLLALWGTGGLNGNYRIALEVVSLPPGSFVPVPDFTDLRAFLDNVPPVAKIFPLEPGDYDTPRIYIPSPAAPGIGCDLMDTRLGNYPVDYGGTADPTCSILDLQGPVGKRYLAFKLTAHHDNGDGVGYLRYWHFRYKRNDSGYQIHIGKEFDGTSMVDDSPIQFSSTENDTKGFQEKFLYLNKSYLEPGIGTSMGSCGYRFVIAATTRTTDGYNYLRWAWDEDIHYIQR